MEQISMQEMQRHIKSLSKQLKFFRLIAVSALIFIAIYVIGIKLKANNEIIDKDEIMCPPGLVLVDAQGRERVLLGIPVPEAKHQIGRALTRVKETWNPQMGEETYMKYCKDYRNDMDELLVLDEK